jgi:hypothetical protein
MPTLLSTDHSSEWIGPDLVISAAEFLIKISGISTKCLTVPYLYPH